MQSCECVVVNTDPCGSTPLKLTASSGTIKSPGYDQNSYENNANCQWLIEAAAGKVRYIMYVAKTRQIISVSVRLFFG